jgi:hypothetical protein
MTIASLTFTIMYAIGSKPWHDRVGRMQLGKSACLSAVLVLTMLNFIFPDYYGRATVRYVAYWTLAAALTYQLYILITEQHKPRDRRRRKEDV